MLGFAKLELQKDLQETFRKRLQQKALATYSLRPTPLRSDYVDPKSMRRKQPKTFTNSPKGHYVI